MPAAWEEVLKTYDISKEEVVQNGTALLDVLRFHFNGVDNKFDSIPYNSLDKQGSNGSPSYYHNSHPQSFSKTKIQRSTIKG